MTRRLVAIPAAAAIALLVAAAPARAHVELDPPEATAGSTTTLTFSFHHGLDGAATTALEVQLPVGAQVVEVPPVEGWTSSVAESAPPVVTWTGGSVPDGVEGRFPLVVRLPAEPGVALFPTIQVTDAGELAWIGEQEGESEDANPAPRLTVTAGEDTPTTTGGATSTTAGSDTTNELPGTALEAEQRDDGNTSTAPWVIGSGIAALAAIAIGGTLLKRRMG